MAADLAGFLAAYAIAMDGHVLTQTWSIGGHQPALTLGGLLGQPQGISYFHNKYEGDVISVAMTPISTMEMPIH
jgi:hypothetical protein